MDCNFSNCCKYCIHQNTSFCSDYCDCYDEFVGIEIDKYRKMHRRAQKAESEAIKYKKLIKIRNDRLANKETWIDRIKRFIFK